MTKNSKKRPDAALRPPTTVGRSLEPLVGKRTYGVWLDMLRRLVPDGRTHRLAVVVAGMLRSAAVVAFEKHGTTPAKGSLAARLFNAADWDDPDEIAEDLSDIVVQLFTDAGVHCERTNRRGDSYSIVDDAIEQYVHWHNMPWDDE